MLLSPALGGTASVRACFAVEHHSAQILTTESRPPETMYRSIYRRRSTGRVCPFVMSVECCMLVRLYIWECEGDKGSAIPLGGRSQRYDATEKAREPTLMPFSPVAATILRVSNCSAVTA